MSADHWNALDAAVFAKLTGSSALGAFLNGGTTGVFYGVAPGTAVPPYVVFNQQAGVPRHTINGAVAYEAALYQVKGITRSPSGKTAGQIADAIDDVLDNTALTVSGHTHMHTRRTSDVKFVEVDAGEVYQHAGAMYRVLAHP